MSGTYSSPEFMVHCMAIAELAHYYYHLPVWGFSGCSDSKVADIQAGIESALWILWTAFSGANLVHDIGYIEAGLTCSYEMIVICDEVISFVRRLMAGVEVNPETLALDVIDEVGPGGDFLGTRHTERHFRRIWYPRLLNRQTYRGWVDAGRPTTIGTAKEIAQQALATHHPQPLPAGVRETLQAMIAEADARATKA
jgi:trimethylamine--corrinoid protein Co-methyltransferase